MARQRQTAIKQRTDWPFYDFRRKGGNIGNTKGKGAKGGGTIRQRPDGRWEARYTLGIDPGTGKQIQKSVYGKTQKEVRQKLTAITAEIDEGTYMDVPRLKPQIG